MNLAAKTLHGILRAAAQMLDRMDEEALSHHISWKPQS